MSDLLERLHFILVRTQFASNLGTSVRAMGNMGLRRLVLIGPECEVGVEARARAMKGAEILDRARFFPDLESALTEIPILVGATARGKAKDGVCGPRQFVQDHLDALGRTPLGVVFGPEDNGLRKDEMKLCHFRLSIPTVKGNSSLNLSQAVSVVAYEMHMAAHRTTAREAPDPAPSAEKLPALMATLDRILGRVDLPPGHSRRRIMKRMRILAARSRWEEDDLNMALGLLSKAVPPDDD